MAITANTKRNWESDDIHYTDRESEAADLVEGAFVTQTAAEDGIRDLVTTAVFVGVVARASDFSQDPTTRIIDEGTLRGATVTGAAATTAPGATVYATDNDVLTLTASGALAVGRVVVGTGTNEADVFIQGAHRRSI